MREGTVKVLQTPVDPNPPTPRTVASRSSTSTTSGVASLRDLGRRDHLDDHLRDPVAGLHGEVGVGVVEEDDPDGAAVVRVDHADAHVDGVLQRKAEGYIYISLSEEWYVI